MYIEVHFDSRIGTDFDNISERKVISMKEYDDYFMTEDIFRTLSIYGKIWEDVDTLIFDSDFEYNDNDTQIRINNLNVRYTKRMRNVKIKNLFD